MNAALQADLADPWRPIYWAAVYLSDEVVHLERDYMKLFNLLKVRVHRSAARRGRRS